MAAINSIKRFTRGAALRFVELGITVSISFRENRRNCGFRRIFFGDWKWKEKSVFLPPPPAALNYSTISVRGEFVDRIVQRVEGRTLGVVIKFNVENRNIKVRENWINFFADITVALDVSKLARWINFNFRLDDGGKWRTLSKCRQQMFDKLAKNSAREIANELELRIAHVLVITTCQNRLERCPSSNAMTWLHRIGIINIVLAKSATAHLLLDYALNVFLSLARHIW